MKNVLYILCCLPFLQACSDDWLTAKREKNQVVPTTLEDMRAILNSTTVMSMANDNAGMLMLSCDDYFVTSSTYRSMSERDRNVYSWNEQIYADPGRRVSEWNSSYNQVFSANIVLDGLQGIPRNNHNQAEWDDVKGGALLFRAKAFYNLAQLFSPPYDVETAGTLEGIPLRLTSDPNVPTKRATIAATYERIVGDLKEAAGLLTRYPEAKTDASRQAAYGLLARCFLSMREYENALTYADSCLRLYAELLDYNTVSAAANYPFERFNAEVIMHSTLSPTYGAYLTSKGRVDSVIYRSYGQHDLRRQLFFTDTGDGYVGFRGSYNGSSTLFSGLTTPEMYLIRAECRAREGDISGALTDLNALRRARFSEESFAPVSAGDASAALESVLLERRRELLFRGLRWSDLRRLNMVPEHATTLTRIVDDQVFTLTPQSPRYVLPIPEYIIEMTGISQNPR